MVFVVGDCRRSFLACSGQHQTFVSVATSSRGAPRRHRRTSRRSSSGDGRSRPIDDRALTGSTRAATPVFEALVVVNAGLDRRGTAAWTKTPDELLQRCMETEQYFKDLSVSRAELWLVVRLFLAFEETVRFQRDLRRETEKPANCDNCSSYGHFDGCGVDVAAAAADVLSNSLLPYATACSAAYLFDWFQPDRCSLLAIAAHSQRSGQTKG